MSGRPMKKDVTDLPPDIQAELRALDSLPDDEIDTTDIPETLDWTGARRGVFQRPAREAEHSANERTADRSQARR